jgi:CheY-like chemotaxis protein
MPEANAIKPRATILLIEDNLADQEMTRRALARVDASIQLVIVDDGEQALDYLLRRDIYCRAEDSPRPDLVLLDLNLPKLSGKDLIARIRGHEQIRHVPLLVLTTSQADEDVLESYRLGCNSYLVKPSRFDQFVSAIERVMAYWLATVCRPPK